MTDYLKFNVAIYLTVHKIINDWWCWSKSCFFCDLYNYKTIPMGGFNMGKLVAKKHSRIASAVFFEIGNSINLSKIIKPKYEPSFISDYQEALTEDWGAVSREVEVALGKFGKVYETKGRPEY